MHLTRNIAVCTSAVGLILSVGTSFAEEPCFPASASSSYYHRDYFNGDRDRGYQSDLYQSSGYGPPTDRIDRNDIDRGYRDEIDRADRSDYGRDYRPRYSQAAPGYQSGYEDRCIKYVRGYGGSGGWIWSRRVVC